MKLTFLIPALPSLFTHWWLGPFPTARGFFPPHYFSSLIAPSHSQLRIKRHNKEPLNRRGSVWWGKKKKKKQVPCLSPGFICFSPRR